MKLYIKVLVQLSEELRANVSEDIQTPIDTITDCHQYMASQKDHNVISRQLDLNIYREGNKSRVHVDTISDQYNN